MAKTYHGLTKSQIMRRAWQLATLNRPNSNAPLRSAGRWQAMAWREARDGETENWSFLSPEHAARALEHQLTVLEYADTRTAAHDALMASLRASVRELRAGR